SLITKDERQASLGATITELAQALGAEKAQVSQPMHAQPRSPRAVAQATSHEAPFLPRGRDCAASSRKVAGVEDTLATGGQWERRPRQTMRCLVIEDDAETARYLRGGLEEAGYTAVVCRNGVEGLHFATNEHWDIVILDRMLPGGVDGLSLVTTLRQLGK